MKVDTNVDQTFQTKEEKKEEEEVQIPTKLEEPKGKIITMNLGESALIQDQQELNQAYANQANQNYQVPLSNDYGDLGSVFHQNQNEQTEWEEINKQFSTLEPEQQNRLWVMHIRDTVEGIISPRFHEKRKRKRIRNMVQQAKSNHQTQSENNNTIPIELVDGEKDYYIITNKTTKMQQYDAFIKSWNPNWDDELIPNCCSPLQTHIIVEFYYNNIYENNGCSLYTETNERVIKKAVVEKWKEYEAAYKAEKSRQENKRRWWQR